MTKEMSAPEFIGTLRKQFGPIADETEAREFTTWAEKLLEGQMAEWLGRGAGIAVYCNEDLGHPQLGHYRYFSFGDDQAQFHGEPPVQLPDFPSEINWRYQLAGTYRGKVLTLDDEHDPAKDAAHIEHGYATYRKVQEEAAERRAQEAAAEKGQS